MYKVGDRIKPLFEAEATVTRVAAYQGLYKQWFTIVVYYTYDSGVKSQFAA